MKYVESDLFSGPLLSCYMNPNNHPACMCCMDRYDCYGKEACALFKEKALVMSDLLEDPDSLDQKNALHLAEALDMPDFVNIIRKILEGTHCPDGKIRLIMTLALEKPQGKASAA